MKLRPQYPASFPILLLAGFILVALPLLGGMVNAAYMVERIVAESHRAIESTLVLTRAGRQLVGGVSNLQRAAGQYYVLEDAALGRGLQEAHRGIQATAAELLKQPLDADLDQQVARLARFETALYARLRAGRGAGGTRFDAYAADFDWLYGAAVAIETQGHRLIDRQVAALGASADAVRRALIWQALAMIPLSLFLTALFSWLISRPVGQLARTIRRLGEDDLTPFPPVEGPRDLAFLGERLDWLRQRLISLEQQQVSFLRHVSHELKTPLAALHEGVELLADGAVGELAPRQREVAHILRGNVRELQRRIEDLIRFQRASQGGEPLARADLALDALLAAAVRRHDLALRGKGIDLALALDGARVRGDRGKLESVFENLLGNAIRFSPSGGRIRVAAEVGEDTRGEGGKNECGKNEGGKRQVAITLCDQGPGVPEADRPHVFRPFYQGSIQPPGALRGSGLGLAIVKEYVEAHGGQVALLAPASGWGACFQVVLPGSEGGNDAR